MKDQLKYYIENCSPNAIQGISLHNGSSINLPMKSPTIEDMNRIEALKPMVQAFDMRALENRIDLEDAREALKEPGQTALEQIKAELGL